MAVHRPTLFNLMNSIVGVSVLAIPFCFHQCGVVLGCLAMVFMMLITKKSCLFLLLSAQLARRRSYESLAQFTYGNAGKLAVEACIIGLMAGTLCAFNVIIGDLGPNIVQSLFQVEVTPSIRATIMISLAFGVGLPLSLMRDISSLANLSAVSLLFYSSFVAQVIFSSLPNLFSGEWINAINLWRPSGFLQSLPIFALAFSCQTQLFGLYDSIPEPSVKKMDAVVHVGMNAVCGVYLCVGFFSYVTFYDVGVKGDILTNYGSSSLAILLNIGFLLSVIVSFPLMVFPMRASINSLLFPSQTAGTENMPGGPGYMPQNRFFYITVSVISFTLMVGIFIPQIEFVLGLTGATMGTIIAMILPASMFLYIVQETQGDHRITAKIILAIGFTCLISSTYITLTTTESSHHKESPKTTLEQVQTTVNIPSNLSELKSVQQPPTTLTVSKDKPHDLKESQGDVIDKSVVKDGDDIKRKEPVLPNAPDKNKEDLKISDVSLKDLGKDKDDKGLKMIKKGADPLNEKRQLMSADESKSTEPIDLKHDESLLAATKPAENKNSSEKLNNLHKEVKKLDSRTKRNIEDKPVEKKILNSAVDDRKTVKKSTTLLPTAISSSKVTEPSRNNTIVIVEPKASFTTEKTLVDASSPHSSNNTGQGVKSRDLKSSETIGRKLHSLPAKMSVWEQRLKRHGSLRKLHKRNKGKLALS